MKKFGDRKIFIVSPTESVLTKRGKRHPNLANFLSLNGEKICYLTSTINHAEKTLFNKKEILQAKDNLDYEVKFFSAGLYKSNITFKRVIWNYIFSLKVLFYLLRNSNKGDMVIFPSRPSELLIVAVLVKIFKKTKLFLDVEDIWPDAFLIKNKLIKFTFYLYCNIINNFSVRFFDSGVHVSENFKDWLKRYNVKYDSKLSVLGVTKEEDMPKYLKEYSKFKKSEITFFYGGTLTLQFDIMPLLEAINKTGFNCKIILAGDNGSGNRFNKVDKFLKENNFKFINLGNVSKKVLLKNLGESDIVIIPMISGGLPKKFFDAIGCFKPILNMGKGGVYSEIEKNGFGWNTTFEIEDIERLLLNLTVSDIASKIKNIHKNREQYMEDQSIKIIYKEIQKNFK